MDSSITIIDPDQQKALSESIEGMAGWEQLEEVLAPMELIDQATYLRDSIRGLGTIGKKISQVITAMLWKVFKDGLWKMPIDGQTPPETFRQWVEDEIEPYVAGKELSSSYLQDIVRIIERQFSYLLINPVFDPDTKERITPERIMEGDPIKKLKMTSSYFLDTRSDSDKDQLIRDIVTMPSREIKQKWIDSRQDEGLKLAYLKIPGNAPGTITVVFRDLDPDRYELLMTLVKGVAQEEIIP